METNRPCEITCKNRNYVYEPFTVMITIQDFFSRAAAPLMWRKTTIWIRTNQIGLVLVKGLGKSENTFAEHSREPTNLTKVWCRVQNRTQDTWVGFKCSALYPLSPVWQGGGTSRYHYFTDMVRSYITSLCAINEMDKSRVVNVNVYFGI